MRRDGVSVPATRAQGSSARSLASKPAPRGPLPRLPRTTLGLTLLDAVIEGDTLGLAVTDGVMLGLPVTDGVMLGETVVDAVMLGDTVVEAVCEQGRDGAMGGRAGEGVMGGVSASGTGRSASAGGRAGRRGPAGCTEAEPAKTPLGARARVRPGPQSTGHAPCCGSRTSWP